jgi:hypothetical protein
MKSKVSAKPVCPICNRRDEGENCPNHLNGVVSPKDDTITWCKLVEDMNLCLNLAESIDDQIEVYKDHFIRKSDVRSLIQELEAEKKKTLDNMETLNSRNYHLFDFGIYVLRGLLDGDKK